jgi:hypothetical protein
MKTDEIIGKNMLQAVGERLLTAQREIDELALQLALGKAEARDKFEEIKQEFRKQVSEQKNLLAKASENFISPEVRAKIEALEVQLALGKADTKDIFEEQKKKITKALTSVEDAIHEQWKKIQAPEFFSHEVEEFKLKLEILRLRFGLKKFEVREDYRTRMLNARKQIEKMVSIPVDKVNKGKTKYNDFKDEVSLAYKHIRRAVESLV